MNVVKLMVANILCLFLVDAMASDSSCAQLEGKLEICPANLDWKLVEGVLQKQATGAVWLHRERREKALHSFLVNKDQNGWEGDMSSYIHFAKHQFLEREFVVLEQKKLENSIEVLKIVTPDKSAVFYQGYLKTNDSTYWSFNCMGPDQKILEKDCETMMSNIRI